MKKIVVVLFVFLSMSLPKETFAWGMTGHRVVGEIATKHLTARAQEEIKRILGHQTLAQVSDFLDDVKSDRQIMYDTLNAYHYVSIPDGLTYAESNINPKGDAIAGLTTVLKKLKEGGLTPELEAFYLKFVVHVVGDLHQPLHVGRAEDRGGNSITFSWFGKSSNLHKVWDSEILDGKKLSYTEITTLINHASTTDVQLWQSHTFDDWVVENMELRESIYDFDSSARSWEYKYMYVHWDIMLHQLLKGGVRLAGILNDIYG